MSIADINKKALEFWEQYRPHILAFFLAVFILPTTFGCYINIGLDGSWVRALNEGIKHHRVFGTDIIFTFGPLGYLSTRNVMNVSQWTMLFSDLFVVAAFSKVFYSFLSQNKGWFFVLFGTIFYFKGCEYGEMLFMLLLIFSVFIFTSKQRNYFDLMASAILGTLVFFIKINYGIMAVPIFLAILLTLLFHDRVAFAVFLLTGLALFLGIYFSVHIDLLNYVRFGLPIIANYPEAMSIDIDPGNPHFIGAIKLILIFLGPLVWYTWRLIRNKELFTGKVAVVVLLPLMCFLMYKNGFTRADGHMIGFFVAMPFFTALSYLLFQTGSKWIAKAMVLVSLFIADENVLLPHTGEGMGFIFNSTLGTTKTYLQTMFQGPMMATNCNYKMSDSMLSIIGQSSIDIFPVDITILLQNNLNYAPRPIMQGYSVYSRALDSLNAQFYYKTTRPEFVLAATYAIDDRYNIWDESFTKAVIHLNYSTLDTFTIHGDHAECSSYDDHVLLKAKPSSAKYPVFTKLYDKTFGITDTVKFNFGDSEAIYVTVDVDYSLQGKARSLAFQPPLLMMSLLHPDTSARDTLYRIVKPQLAIPALVNKVVVNNVDLMHFMSGDLKKLRNIKGFVFHPRADGFKQNMRVTFYRFENY